ncbi:hypothetical protein PRIPAC_87218, partial [Pristionchus pacificus]
HYSPVELVYLPSIYSSLLFLFRFTNQRGQPSLLARDSNLQQTMGSLEGPSFIDIQIMNVHYGCEKKCKRRLNCKNGGFIDSRNCAKCKCPSGFNGDLCEKDDYGDTIGCGGELNAEIVEKELSMTVMEGKKCNYHIKAPIGKKISIVLKSVHGRCEHGCGRDRIEFKVNSDPRPIGYRFCCPEEGSRRFSSLSSSLPVLISSVTSPSSVQFTYKLA